MLKYAESTAAHRQQELLLIAPYFKIVFNTNCGISFILVHQMFEQEPLQGHLVCSAISVPALAEPHSRAEYNTCCWSQGSPAKRQLSAKQDLCLLTKSASYMVISPCQRPRDLFTVWLLGLLEQQSKAAAPEQIKLHQSPVMLFQNENSQCQ